MESELVNHLRSNFWSEYAVAFLDPSIIGSFWDAFMIDLKELRSPSGHVSY